MSENVPQNQREITNKPRTKFFVWNAGLYLTPLVFAGVLILWGHLLTPWMVIASATFVLVLFVWAGCLHIKESGGVAGYIHSRLLGSISIIVLICCMILGTGMYLVMRPVPSLVKLDNFRQMGALGQTLQTPGIKANMNKPVAEKWLNDFNETRAVRAKKPSKKIAAQKTVQQVVAMPISAQTPSQQPTYEQKCEGSACAQGPGSQATYNQYGAPTLVMTDVQRDAITETMRQFTGQKVHVSISLAEPDSGTFGEQLVIALQYAGMIVEHSEAYMLVVGGAPSSGVSFAFSEEYRPTAVALATVMRSVGATSAPIPATITSGTFSIVVQPNK